MLCRQNSHLQIDPQGLFARKILVSELEALLIRSFWLVYINYILLWAMFLRCIQMVQFSTTPESFMEIKTIQIL